LGADDPEGQARIAAFLRELQRLGWSEGRNVRIEYRWGTGDADRIRRDAAELVSVRFHRHAHLPIVQASDLFKKAVRVPWWDGRLLRFIE
jgi:hypothetical protein